MGFSKGKIRAYLRMIGKDEMPASEDSPFEQFEFDFMSAGDKASTGSNGNKTKEGTER